MEQSYSWKWLSSCGECTRFVVHVCYYECRYLAERCDTAHMTNWFLVCALTCAPSSTVPPCWPTGDASVEPDAGVMLRNVLKYKMGQFSIRGSASFQSSPLEKKNRLGRFASVFPKPSSLSDIKWTQQASNMTSIGSHAESDSQHGFFLNPLAHS